MNGADLPVYGQVPPRATQGFKQPVHEGPLAKFNGHARVTGPCCDTMEFWIQVNARRIVEASFTTSGCGASRAAGSMATELAIGKRLMEAMQIDQADILAALGGLPEKSEHCALLAANTLKAAIADYASRKGNESRVCQSSESTNRRFWSRRHDETHDGTNQSRRPTRRIREIGRTLVILSGRGGVGQSTVAANLAITFAQAGKRVGLFDIDVRRPSIPKLLGMERECVQESVDGVVPPQLSDRLVVMSVGFAIASSQQPVVSQENGKEDAIRQFATDIAWGQRDYLVVDSSPDMGDEPATSIALFGAATRAIVVTTPQEVAICDARRCITRCNDSSLPVVGLVENMSGLVCPKCGERIDPFKRGGGMALAREMDIPFLGQIPIDPDIVMAGDAGRPLLRNGPQSPAARTFVSAADLILASHF
jgi:ATP-binding protein involved in chromosome partitioning